MKTSIFARVLIVVVGGLALAGCSNLDETQQKMLSGGAIGAGTGAVVTLATGGCVACGAAVGAAVGAAGGYIVDQVDGETSSSSSSGSQSSGGYNGGYNNSNYNSNNYPPSNGYNGPGT